MSILMFAYCIYYTFTTFILTPGPAHFVEPLPATYEVAAGEDVELKCSLSGNPHPSGKLTTIWW